MMKPGITSSEFWMSILLILFAAWLVWQNKTDAGLALVGPVAGYWIGSRTGMKVGNGVSKPQSDPTKPS